MDSGTLDQAVNSLRAQGALFAFLHGSQATGTATEASDIDIAAYFPEPAPASFDIDLPPGVDLLILNGAPLELAGRTALDGRLILDEDEVARVRWLARTRKIYSDEKYRIDRAHAEFLAAVRGG
jgi:predicted nucleotidyltransferase